MGRIVRGSYILTKYRVKVASPSCGQFSPTVFGGAQQAGRQLAGQSTQLARGAIDFAKFGDKSQQVQRNFTMSEVAQCTGKNGGCLYIVCDGKVLDLTDFVPFHAGGRAALMKYAGKDATAAMRASGMPPKVFDVFLKKFVIGHVVSAAAPTPTPPAASNKPCGWFATSTGLCEYIFRIERIYDKYKRLITRIFVQDDGTNDQLARIHSLTNTTAL